jgi:hypothetical protein
MPYRTTRAFRDQLDVLALLGQLEHARSSAEAAAARGRQRLAAREQRRAERLAASLAAALERPSLRRVAPEDLLPGVRDLLAAGPPAAADGAPPSPPARNRLVVALACACAAAWAATLAAAAAGGISGRPELVVPDVAALTLTLAAVLVRLRSG